MTATLRIKTMNGQRRYSLAWSEDDSPAEVRSAGVAAFIQGDGEPGAYLIHVHDIPADTGGGESR